MVLLMVFVEVDHGAFVRGLRWFYLELVPCPVMGFQFRFVHAGLLNRLLLEGVSSSETQTGKSFSFQGLGLRV